MQKVETELGGVIDPAFKDHKIEKIRDARMELRGSVLLVFVGEDLIGQCAFDHPGLIRHMDQLEKIFGIHIKNKEWMIREVTAYQLEADQNGEEVSEMPKCPLCQEELHWSGDHDDGERSWGDYYHDQCGVYVQIFLDGKTAMGEEIEDEKDQESGSNS